MLAVTANWEITDGSLVPSRAAAADAWLGVIQRAAIRAGWSRAGRYQPVTEVCLVFAGDTFNWLATDIWAGRDRPWHGGRNGQDARMRAALAGLQASRLVVRTLRRWMGNGMPVPAAGLHGRPSARGMQTRQRFLSTEARCRSRDSKIWPVGNDNHKKSKETNTHSANRQKLKDRTRAYWILISATVPCY